MRCERFVAILEGVSSGRDAIGSGPEGDPMELILAVIVAGPLGYLVHDRRRALLAFLLAWAVVFPVQCVVVKNTGDLDWSYWPINAVILAAGIGFNHLGRVLRLRRRPVIATAGR
jgi:hypothetical protein